MKVLVVGSNGQIGQRLIQLLRASQEHTVRAMVRKKNKPMPMRSRASKRCLQIWKER